MNSKCPKIMHENLMTRIKQKRKVNVNRTQYLFTSQIRPAAQSRVVRGVAAAALVGAAVARCGITSDSRYITASIIDKETDESWDIFII